MTRYAIIAATFALLFLCIVAGFGFLLAAAYIGLAEVLHPGWAAAIVGAALIVFCTLDLLIVLALTRRGGSPPASGGGSGIAGPQDGGGASKEEIAMMLAGQLTRSVERHPKEASLAALGIGALLGASPGLRRHLSDLFK